MLHGRCIMTPEAFKRAKEITEHMEKLHVDRGMVQCVGLGESFLGVDGHSFRNLTPEGIERVKLALLEDLDTQLDLCVKELVEL
jgi:hypothetical protein